MKTNVFKGVGLLFFKIVTLAILVTFGAVGTINSLSFAQEENSNYRRLPQKNSLSIVDITFNEQAENFPILDITITNTGDIALLKRADFRVKDIWTLITQYCASAESASWNYDIILPIRGAPYKKSFKISQSIKPQAADRFRITIGNDAPKIYGSDYFIFMIEIDFIYDEDDKILSTSTIAFVTRPAVSIWANTKCVDIRTVHLHNKAIINKLKNFDGRISPELEKIRAKLSESIVPSLLEKISKAQENEDIKYYVEFLAFLQSVDDKAEEALNNLYLNSKNPYVIELINKLKKKEPNSDKKTNN